MVHAKIIKLAMIGCGYWGKNLLRNLAELGVLGALSDNNSTLAASMAQSHNTSAQSYENILMDSSIQGVVIATPAITHASLARSALEANKHVFVEKPLALNVNDAQQLAQIAREKNLILMIGHLLQYHPAFITLCQEVNAKRIGKIRYIQSHRASFGKVRTEENVLWSFAPHDISMILALTGEKPQTLSAQASSYVSPAIADIATLQMSFTNEVRAHILVSWLHPIKEHRIMVIGENGALVFDDSLPWEQKLMLYQNKISFDNGFPIAEKGEAIAIPVAKGEPLRAECEHFINAISQNAPVRTHAEEAIRVLETLTAAERALTERKEVTLADSSKNYFVHETAIVDKGCEIGEGSKIWHFSHLLAGTKLGKNVNVGQNVMIGPHVTVGNYCKIQNNVSLYNGVTLEEGVFCGPSCVFTNVNTPRSGVERKDAFLPTHVGRGATIGANATIVCGNQIGEYCLIGAGAVVTKDVKPHALVVGNPARQIGWVSHSGEKLGKDLVCPREGRRYRETANGLLEELNLPVSSTKKKDETIDAN